MCFSLPLLLLSVESCLRICGLDEVESEREVFAVREESEIEESESTLVERPGTCRSFESLRISDHRGEKTGLWSGAQQKVSRFHNLQLRFSYRLPSSIDSAHFEKTDHRPNRFSTLRVSIVCIELGSTRTMGFSERKGILAALGASLGAVVGMKTVELHRWAVCVVGSIPGGDDCVKIGRPVEEVEPRRSNGRFTRQVRGPAT